MGDARGGEGPAETPAFRSARMPLSLPMEIWTNYVQRVYRICTAATGWVCSAVALGLPGFLGKVPVEALGRFHTWWCWGLTRIL